ncbi:hypothetical protein [Streptomyces adelaidensis]|uniref:hypothetical protein n=1 Tax=Streptomyces adelaidensis TaxID=2796465 RepID=UPI001904A68C|nr:hypothetical protein [Streptomyces adelaidensis]
MAARDNSRRDAEYDDIAHGDAAHDDIAHEDIAYDDLAYDDIAQEGVAYDGLDALMAALIDEPLPEEALTDAEFMAARRAAAADVVLLREQLGLIGEALTAPGEEAEAGAPPGRLAAARPGDAAGAETGPGHTSGSASGPETAPLAPVRPLPTRPDRTRRALRGAFGTLAAAVAASVVLGAGWVVVQAGRGMGDSASSAKSDADSGADESNGRTGDLDGESGSDSKLSRMGYLACARLVVEGTVVGLEPVSGGEEERVTVDVDRYYKPAKGADEIVFPMDKNVSPRLKEGDHVLIGISPNSAEPDLWAVGERRIAGEREWIEDGLAEVEGVPCGE